MVWDRTRGADVIITTGGATPANQANTREANPANTMRG